MKELPPLPLYFDEKLAPSGALIVDNSTIELLKCPRLLELKWLRRRDLAASRAGRNFGSTLHQGWATRYQLAGSNAVTPPIAAAISESMRQWLEEKPQPAEDFRNFNHACKVMDAYNSIYGNEPFKILCRPSDGKPLVECTFALPFGTVQGIKIFYAGKLDTAVEDHNGVWSFDHKTTFQFGAGFEDAMLRDGGQLGYVWAMSQVLQRRVTGYIIDAVRIRRPTKKSEFSENGCIDGSDFKRLPYAVSDEVLEGWKADVLSHISSILTMHRNGFFPEARWSCVTKYGKCDFYEACALPPSQRDGVLYNSTLFEENVWTPLHLPTANSNQESKV